MKYYGEKTKQDLIDIMYESEIDFAYKEANYDFWLDGNGYNFGLTYLGGKDVSSKEHMQSIVSAETVEELIEKFVFYDGMRFADVIEMDVESYHTMKLID